MEPNLPVMEVELEVMAEEAAPKHKGILVAAWLDPATAHEVAIDGGETEDALHITLVYIGDAPPASAARVVAEVAIAAALEDPLEGEVSGMGRFMASATSDGKDVIYAVPDVPGLSAIRERIADGLRGAGFEFDKEHGWTPHITLAYIDPAEPTPFSEPMEFGGPGSGRYPRGSGKSPKDRGPTLVKYGSPAEFVAKATEEDIRKIYGLSKEAFEKVEVHRGAPDPNPNGNPIPGNLTIRAHRAPGYESISPIENIERTFYGNGEVHHSLLILTTSKQGEGTAAKMNAAAEEHYKASGFTHITLNADIDIGKYAWARQGYDFDGPHPREKVMMHARAELDRVQSKLLDHVKQRSEVMHAWELAALDDGHKYTTTSHYGGKIAPSTDGSGYALGKAIMLSGTSWNGIKKLTPSVSQAVGEAYFKAKGAKK